MKLFINSARQTESKTACEVVIVHEYSAFEYKNTTYRSIITNGRAIAEELPVIVSKLLNETGHEFHDITHVATNITDAPSMRLRICCAYVSGLARGLGVKAVGYKMTENNSEPDFTQEFLPLPQYVGDAGVTANVPEPIVHLEKKSLLPEPDENEYKVEILRDMSEETLNELYKLEEELFARDKWSKESLEAAFNSGIYTFVCIKYKGKIVASSYLAQRDINIFDIDSVGVSTAHQGKSLGNMLMNSVFDQIKAGAFAAKQTEGIVNLEVRVSNERAINLYKKFGFIPIRQVKAYYKNPLEDAVFMMNTDLLSTGTPNLDESQHCFTLNNDDVVSLGIETSCDETGVAVVSNHHILAEKLATSLNKHIEYGGVIPEIAAREHIQTIDTLVQKALEDAKIDISRVDNICVTTAPGLIGCLNVGSAYAKGLSMGAKKPVYALNHLIGHLMAAELATKSSLPQQFLGLIVSGGHSDLLLRVGRTAFKHLGGTIDDAAGEAFDKVGRILGINYPAGKEIDSFAKHGNPNSIQFPRPLTGAKYDQLHRYDFSFSGLKTAAIRELEAQKQLTPNDRIGFEDFCASFQEAVVDVLVNKTMRAATEFNQTTIVLGGGFSANSRLRAKLQDKCAERGISLIMPEIKYCTDNGSMIANLGALVQDQPPNSLDFSAKSVLPLECVVV